ncbi:sigma factor-like helix-turn-helix DNA-binding protein [uncultured Blautia sp.]|uniref:sigma factor-like helix-turn-helix DNA-binding protein n=1 Tax=Blautia marasmi TaxID=1917868 RepID=UPI002598CFAE|nr:sigma factor-like helix-turn-helix DNA-binding protein [uncultured Blautia sp.]
MDKKTLERYKPLKRELLMIDKQISKLEERREELPVVMGKVQSSDHEFPYTERRVSVQMYEPKEADKIDREIVRKRARKRQIESEMEEIKEFIENMPEGEDRQVFELYYLEGMKQREVADIVGLEQSSISKKITTYLQLSYNS